MKPTITISSVLFLAGLLHGTARAQDPAFSVVPPCIPLVGSAGGVIDPAGQFGVLVADGGGPLAGCTVTIDFSGCCLAPPDIRIATAPLCPSCAYAVGPMISSGPTVGGVAVFRIVGSATNGGVGPSPAAGAGCAVVSADCGTGPVVLGTATVVAYDQGGVNGVNAADLAAWLKDFFSPPLYEPRSDYDCSGTLGANDVSTWLGVFFAAGSITSGIGLSCP